MRTIVTAGFAAYLAASAATAAVAPRWAVAVLPSGHSYSLEIAADELSRQRGYMGRESVGPREGMIFMFDEDARHSFWMKDCKVALDMVWIDSGGRVVWIAADRKPCPASGDCPSIVPPQAARNVLEFAAGTAARESLRAGEQIVILSDPPLR